MTKENFGNGGIIVGLIGIVVVALLSIYTISTRIDSAYDRLADTQSYVTQRMDNLIDSLGGRMDALGQRMDVLGERFDIMNSRIDALYSLAKQQLDIQRLQE